MHCELKNLTKAAAEKLAADLTAAGYNCEITSVAQTTESVYLSLSGGPAGLRVEQIRISCHSCPDHVWSLTRSICLTPEQATADNVISTLRTTAANAQRAAEERMAWEQRERIADPNANSKLRASLAGESREQLERVVDLCSRSRRKGGKGTYKLQGGAIIKLSDAARSVAAELLAAI